MDLNQKEMVKRIILEQRAQDCTVNRYDADIMADKILAVLSAPGEVVECCEYSPGQECYFMWHGKCMAEACTLNVKRPSAPKEGA